MTYTNEKIKAVVFDFGGVIELYEGQKTSEMIAVLLGVPVSKLEEVYFQHNHLMNIENVDREEVWVKVTSVFDQSKADVVRSMIKASSGQKKINTGLLDILPKIRQQGLKIAIFSNYNNTLRERLKELGIIGLVDEIVISSEIGFQKPHKEAFRVLFEKLNMQPQEVVFIDDTAKSLEGASEIGYVPILFKSNEQLKIDLENAGVSL